MSQVNPAQPAEQTVEPAQPSTYSYLKSFFLSPPDDCDTAYNDAVKAAADTKKPCKVNKTTTTPPQTGGKAKKSKGGKAKKVKKSKKNQKK